MKNCLKFPALTQPKDEEIKESEVTSTVSIKTPEENIIASTNPSVWNGDIDMPDVARFSVTAHQVSGTSDYLGMVSNVSNNNFCSQTIIS